MGMNRRIFVIHSIMGAAAAAVGVRVGAELPKLQESDPQAVLHGYKLDAAKTDKVKFPKYEAGQTCGNCALFEDQPGGWGKCAAFPGKLITTAGWCDLWGQ